MKLNLSHIPLEDFIVKNVNVFDIPAVLVYPKAFPKWDDNNKFYRSSLWRLDNLEPLSLGFKKFTNLGESPDFEPVNYNKPIEYITKLDGSLLICSKINGNLITRTRGTIDARSLDNGVEIDSLIQKYPKLFNNEVINSEEYSILAEWTTPTNVICIKESTEPSLWLIGIVEHSDYSYSNQLILDEFACEWQVNRPKRFSFKNFDEAVKFSEASTEIEGLVLYCNNGQVLKKVKSNWYLKLHRFKSNANIDTVIDLFVEYKYPSYNNFRDKLVQQFDYECFQLVQGFCSKVCEAYEESQRIIFSMKEFLDRYNSLSRKELAIKVLQSYGQTNRASFVFTLLDKKILEEKQIKKLIYQCL